MSKVKTTSVWRKPEFWTTVVTGVSGLLTCFGVLTPEQADGVASCVTTVVGALLALFSTTAFVRVIHAEKVEVFRAMCALGPYSRANADDKPASTCSTTEDGPCVEIDVSEIARSVGL